MLLPSLLQVTQQYLDPTALLCILTEPIFFKDNTLLKCLQTLLGAKFKQPRVCGVKFFLPYLNE
jgi:hypothetical protein